MEIAMRLNHLDLPVTDTCATKAFFERHFGFKTIFEREDGLVVMLDDARFALTLSPVPTNSPGEVLVEVAWCDNEQ
jgi:catechol 2,3-dioxygenase-like lactoylglutathione lyase family enzyme